MEHECGHVIVVHVHFDKKLPLSLKWGSNFLTSSYQPRIYCRDSRTIIS